MVAHSRSRAAGSEPASRSGGRQRADEPAGLGEIVGRGDPGLPDMAEGRAGPLRQGALGGTQQQLDAGQALREGVVDLAGQAFTFGEDSRGVLGVGQFAAGRGQLLDEPAALFALAVEGLVAEDDGDRDGGAEGGARGPCRRRGCGCAKRSRRWRRRW